MGLHSSQPSPQTTIVEHLVANLARRLQFLKQPIFLWWALSLGMSLLADLLILNAAPLLLKTVAVLLLTNLLPGALLVAWLVGQSAAPPPWWEQGLYSIGAGYGCMVLPLLAISYLPGGVTRDQVLVVFHFLIVGLLLLNQRRLAKPTRPSNMLSTEKPNLTAVLRHSLAGRQWLCVGLLTLALTAGFFRFTALDYAEFQGDEARLTLYASQVIQGYENVLFIHRKGPAEILVPTAIYALTDRLTETTARLPFALANFAAIFGVCLLGWRLFGPVAGWAAAMLLAVDGYLISFARVAQYQSIVLLTVVLIVLLGERVVRQPKALARYFMLAALLFATGLLAHYEAALVLIPVVYWLWQLRRQGCTTGQLVRALLMPALCSTLLLASFYGPFISKPDFGETYGYLTGYRMGAGGVYNHLSDFFNRTTVYSSTYYLLTLIGLAVIGLLQLYWRNLRGRWRWLVVGIVLGGLALTFHTADWLRIGNIDYTWVFFAGLFGAAWLLPKSSVAERVVWLWFGAPLLLALFFTAIPNTHVYNFFIAWALLAGKVIADGWQWLARRFPPSFPASFPHWLAQSLAVTVAVAGIGLFGAYEYWYFVYHDVEVLRTWPVNRPRGYWVTYDQPADVAIFGFPLNNGWKTVAGLYSTGILQGNYATNAPETVAAWYTRGANNCARDVPNYYILVNRVEPTRAAETAKLRQQLQSDHELLGTVLVRGQPGLEIYQAGKTGITPQTFPLEPYAARFDRILASPDLAANGPVGPLAIQHPLNIRLK